MGSTGGVSSKFYGWELFFESFEFLLFLGEESGKFSLSSDLRLFGDARLVTTPEFNAFWELESV
jgi:hypothetical protein